MFCCECVPKKEIKIVYRICFVANLWWIFFQGCWRPGNKNDRNRFEQMQEIVFFFFLVLSFDAISHLCNSHLQPKKPILHTISLTYTFNKPKYHKIGTNFPFPPILISPMDGPRWYYLPIDLFQFLSWFHPT